MTKRPYHRVSEHEINWLRQNVPGRPWKEIYRLYQQEFPNSRSPKGLQRLTSRYGIFNGLNSHFPKNKAHPRFVPVGFETLDRRYGYVYVKVAESTDAKKNWVLKHHLVWEKHHGKIPPGHRVIFLDNNPRNCEIENLALVTVGEHGFLNMNHLRFDDPALTKASISKIKLDEKIRKLEKDSHER